MGVGASEINWGCQVGDRWSLPCGINALVPTGTSAFNDPAAFVTIASFVSIEERNETGEEVQSMKLGSC